MAESYKEPYVYVIEALTSGCEGRLNVGSCDRCVRRSKYTRNGKALFKHEGWKGYFRTIIKND